MLPHLYKRLARMRQQLELWHKHNFRILIERAVGMGGLKDRASRRDDRHNTVGFKVIPCYKHTNAPAKKKKCATEMC